MLPFWRKKEEGRMIKCDGRKQPKTPSKPPRTAEFRRDTVSNNGNNQTYFKRNNVPQNKVWIHPPKTPLVTL